MSQHPFYPWSHFTDEELLEWRICNLGLDLNQSEIQIFIEELYDNLRAHNLVFMPPCYLADEWFVLEGKTSIGIPFYLTHPRLKQLEQKMMLEVEGGTKESFLKFLRHEAGHAYYYAYEFHKKRIVHEIFGPPSQEETPQTYRPKPYSKSFVRHLDNWYAQIEPDEDFAETFAVWLDPQSEWQAVYKGWPAMEKLKLMDEILNNITGKKPIHQTRDHAYGIKQLKLKLVTYYKRKQKLYAQEYPDFYDPDLENIFSANVDTSHSLAHDFLKRNRKILVDKISHWTGEKKFIINNLIKKLIERCLQLHLRLNKSEPDTLLEITAFLTSLVSNYLYTGKFKPSV